MCSFGFWVMLVVLMLRTLRPIQELTTQVQKIRSGERVTPLSESIAEEISVLIREFNGMADAVTERDLRLNERANALDLLSIRLQQALDSIASAVFVVENSKIAMLNPAAQELWGLNIDDAPPSRLANRSLGHHPETPIDNRIVRIDIAEFGQDGSIIVTEDITKQVEDRERLYQTQRLALIGRMLAQVTHEVRNPLNAISLNVEMLSDESLSKDGVEMLQLIQSEIHRLEQSTQRYLDLSRQREPALESLSHCKSSARLCTLRTSRRRLRLRYLVRTSLCWWMRISYAER